MICARNVIKTKVTVERLWVDRSRQVGTGRQAVVAPPVQRAGRI